jgi:hypothetical protein
MTCYCDHANPSSADAHLTCYIDCK